jgi:hypothetical protein
MGPSRADRRRSHTSRLTLIPEVEKLRSRTNQRGPTPFPLSLHAHTLTLIHPLLPPGGLRALVSCWILMHQSQDSNPGLEVTYLVKFSFPATMLDSLFLVFDRNMPALHESSVPL